MNFISTTLPPLGEEEEYEDVDDEEEEYEDEYETPSKITRSGDKSTTDANSSIKTTPVAYVVTEPPTVTVRTSGNGRVFTQGGPTQKQTAFVPHGDNFRLVQTQNGRSTVHAVTTERTQQTVVNAASSTTPKYTTRYLPTKKDSPTTATTTTTTADEMEEGPEPEAGSAQKTGHPDSYISVTKQVTGIDEKSKVPAIPGKNYESTYYTKSSTCGYFTFSCNIVYGENGRSKICRPKPPANGKC